MRLPHFKRRSITEGSSNQGPSREHTPALSIHDEIMRKPEYAKALADIKAGNFNPMAETGRVNREYLPGQFPHFLTLGQVIAIDNAAGKNGEEWAARSLVHIRREELEQAKRDGINQGGGKER